MSNIWLDLKIKILSKNCKKDEDYTKSLVSLNYLQLIDRREKFYLWLTIILTTTNIL